MEGRASLAAALERSAMAVDMALIAAAGSLVVALVATVAIVLDIRAWGRRMDERAAMREREHQESMVALEMDTQQ